MGGTRATSARLGFLGDAAESVARNGGGKDEHDTDGSMVHVLLRSSQPGCGPRPRSPRPAGLCRWTSPPGFPLSAPPKLCGFDLLPLQATLQEIVWEHLESLRRCIGIMEVWRLGGEPSVRE